MALQYGETYHAEKVVALTLDKVSKNKKEREEHNSTPTTSKQEAAVSPWQDFARPVDLLDLIIERQYEKASPSPKKEQKNG